MSKLSIATAFTALLAVFGFAAVAIADASEDRDGHGRRGVQMAESADRDEKRPEARQFREEGRRDGKGMHASPEARQKMMEAVKMCFEKEGMVKPEVRPSRDAKMPPQIEKCLKEMAAEKDFPGDAPMRDHRQMKRGYHQAK